MCISRSKSAQAERIQERAAIASGMRRARADRIASTACDHGRAERQVASQDTAGDDDQLRSSAALIDSSGATDARTTLVPVPVSRRVLTVPATGAASNCVETAQDAK